MDQRNDTMKINLEMDRESEVHEIIETVYDALQIKGYDPISQIVGYIMSGDPTYITSYKNARSLIMKVERDELVEYLKEKGIGTIIHYPIPPHLSEAYQYLGHREGFLPVTEEYANTVLSIPMYNGMTAEELDYIIEALNAF